MPPLVIFFAAILAKGLPKKLFSLRKRKSHPILVYSDARWSEDEELHEHPAGLGFLVYREEQWYYAAATCNNDFMKKFIGSSKSASSSC